MILIHNYKIYVTNMTCNPNNTKRWVQRVVQHTQHILTISYKKTSNFSFGGPPVLELLRFCFKI
jgi:hypothetical protein